MTKIKVYSTPLCPWCIKVKELLKENKIHFEDINISLNKGAAGEAIKKSGQTGVPVIEIDGKILVGFDEDKLKELLKL